MYRIFQLHICRGQVIAARLHVWFAREPRLTTVNLTGVFCFAPGYLCEGETLEVAGCMADSTPNAVLRIARCIAPATLLAISLGGCSFDLGSFSLGPDKEAAPKASATPTAEI